MKLLPFETTVVAFELGQSPTALAEALAEVETVEEVTDPDTVDETLLPDTEELMLDTVEVLAVFVAVDVLVDPEVTSLAPQTPPLVTDAPSVDFK